ncbi:hypothetical protein HN51_004452 [Arachis hypogaea]
MAAASSSAPKLKRMNSITENILDTLRQSRYHMKRYFANYLEKRRRIMKLHHLMEEMEQVINDKTERDHVLEGNLGFILSHTQRSSNGGGVGEASTDLGKTSNLNVRFKENSQREALRT